MATLFDKPADTSAAPGQELIPAGAFLLVADPHERAFARAAAALSQQGSEPPAGPLPSFSKMARSFAHAIGISGPARAHDWARAFSSASDALASFGHEGPAPGSIPIELHSHGTLSIFREALDLFTLLPALKRFSALAKQTAEISSEISAGIDGSARSAITRSPHATPDGTLAASKIHALIKFSGPSYLNSPFGPGTDRILIGSGNTDITELAMTHMGECLARAAQTPMEPALAGKTLALLHESFHLSQGWKSQAENSVLSSVFPAFLHQSPSLQESSQAFWNLALDHQSDPALSWMFKTLEESFADTMATAAMARKEPQRAIALAEGMIEWRDTLKERMKRKTRSPLLRKLLRALESKKQTPLDPHHTQEAMRSFQDILRSGSLSASSPAADWEEAARVAAYAGILRLCAQRLAFSPATDPMPAKERRAAFQSFNHASETIRTLLRAAPAPFMLTRADKQHLAQAGRDHAASAIQAFCSSRPALNATPLDLPPRRRASHPDLDAPLLDLPPRRGAWRSARTANSPEPSPRGPAGPAAPA